MLPGFDYPAKLCAFTVQPNAESLEYLDGIILWVSGISQCVRL